MEPIKDKLFSYGCWCQLRNSDTGGILDGQGPPVDQLDAACKVSDVHFCPLASPEAFSSRPDLKL